MKDCRALTVLAVVLWLTAVVAAQQSSPRRATPRASTIKAVATVQDLMLALVDPNADAIFGAVATTISIRGTETKAPKNDNEWAVVRNHALTLVETGNLLKIGVRRIATPASIAAAALQSEESASVADKAAAIELTPEEIERRVAANPAAWVRQAQELIDAGMAALKAADAKDAEALLEAGDTIDGACEHCHLRYWYPKRK